MSPPPPVVGVVVSVMREDDSGLTVTVMNDTLEGWYHTQYGGGDGGGFVYGG
jgi:hypothetical protein